MKLSIVHNTSGKVEARYFDERRDLELALLEVQAHDQDQHTFIATAGDGRIYRIGVEEEEIVFRLTHDGRSEWSERARFHLREWARAVEAFVCHVWSYPLVILFRDLRVGEAFTTSREGTPMRRADWIFGGYEKHDAIEETREVREIPLAMPVYPALP